jgi:hypothetical protein
MHDEASGVAIVNKVEQLTIKCEKSWSRSNNRWKVEEAEVNSGA